MPKTKKHRNIPVKTTFKIFCEGEKTEPLYIKGYINNFHSEHRGIILIEHTNKNTPVQLVDVAIKAKEEGTEGDIVWVVFDRESEQKYPHQLHAEARDKAKSRGIEIALSNVCFELWILLHFEYCTAPYNSCDDLLKRSNLKSNLRKIGINEYEKGLPLLFNALHKENKIPTAMKNAAKLKSYALSTANRGVTAPHCLNPYIDVHEIFLDMQNFIECKASVRT